MSADTDRENLLIAHEQIAPEDFLHILTGVYASIILVYDLESKNIKFTQEQFCNVLGYESEDCEKDTNFFYNLIHPDDVNNFSKFLVSVATHGSKSSECLVRFKTNGGIYASYRLKTRGEGRYSIILGVNAENIKTEQEEINELKRTKAQAIEELQRSNKELEEFAYVASHDLQEPLRKITTFSGRLSEKFSDQLNEEGSLYINRIIASADNMRILIDNLLDFSRISRVKQSFAPVNLNFILHQIKSDLEINIEETGTVIKAQNLPTIEASLSQMKQLFLNLITNAIKFHKKDQVPEIEIVADVLPQQEAFLLKLDENTTYYRIKFCDSGIGFEDEYAVKIFQIFQRLHGKSEYPGSGIGLAICKKIVDHHHGLISAENMTGKGACFTIILPASQKNAVPINEQ